MKINLLNTAMEFSRGNAQKSQNTPGSTKRCNRFQVFPILVKHIPNVVVASFNQSPISRQSISKTNFQPPPPDL